MNAEIRTDTYDEKPGPIAWMARNSVAANLLMWFCLAGGVIAFMNITQEVFPDIEQDQAHGIFNRCARIERLKFMGCDTLGHIIQVTIVAGMVVIAVCVLFAIACHKFPSL